MGDPLNAAPPEPKILVNGVPVPIDIAGKAVSRCIRGIQHIDRIIATQGFASEDDLRTIRAGLTGEDKDIASGGGNVIQ